MITNRNRKKAVALLLVIIMVMGMLPFASVLAETDESEIPEKAAYITVITGTTGMVAPMVEAYHYLTGTQNYPITLKIFSPGDLEITDRRQLIEDSILQSDIVLIEMVGANRGPIFNQIFSKLDPENQPHIFVQRSGEKNSDGTWATSGFIVEIVKDLEIVVNKDNDVWTRLNQYIVNGGVKNHVHMQLYLASVFGGIETDKTVDDLAPIVVAGNFIYHPAADSSSPLYEEGLGYTSGIFYDENAYFAWYESRAGRDPSAPWIGMMGYDSFFKNADMELYNDTIVALEKRGLNVIPVYPTSTGRNAAARKYFFRDLNGDGVKEPAIHTFILCIGFAFHTGNEANTLALFREMNVPVLNPIYDNDLEKWFSDPAGSRGVVHWQVAMPELEGRIEPVMMGGTVVKAVDEATGAQITTKITLPDRIERLAGRAEAWARLKQAENHEKKVAVLYYNIGGGKDDIGASYLNVPRSLTEILTALRNNAYRINENGELNDSSGQITEDAVFDIMFSKGRNIGGWAPGELAKFASQEGIIKLDVNRYLEWFQALPPALRQKVEDQWGPAPGSVMVYNGEFILPGYISGNIFFGPQPMRGWGEDINKIIHSPDLPPHHQYLAFYFWLQHEFAANAVVHLGTHGTAEWLPGKSVGLSAECWPDIVHGNMPNIYPYIVINPGEGTQAKRRGYAVLISHLTAAVSNTELYGNLLELHNLIHEYEDALKSQDDTNAERLKGRIMFLLDDEGVAEEMGYSLSEISFDELLDKVHDYLHILESTLTPLGLHTFGVVPQGERFDQMVDAIVSYDPEEREALRSIIEENLRNTTEEMVMLLLALDAGFIAPGLGKDPVRNPAVMPTGKNINSFDPRTVPDRLAWRTGKELADKLLAAYYLEHGRYPESVGVILWAIETMRTDGESIAMAMRLLGIEPVWDSSGRVTSYKKTPVSELDRPRIDVVITTSGLFRDTFSVVSSLLDRAVRELALLAEDPSVNYIKKHYDVIKAELMAEGFSEQEASFLASSRVFSAGPGTYGLGLSEMMDFSDQWESTDALAALYVNRMGYIYGENLPDGSDVYGIKAPDLLKRVLQNVEAVVQIRDSIYGTLDNDDVSQYLGGLKLASEWASGKTVAAYIANSRLGPNNLFIQTLQEFVTMEIQSRLLNPQFINEILKEGYSGARTLAKWFTNAFYMDITAGVISDQAWSKLVSTYLFTPDIKDSLHPYPLQSMIATVLEAARKNLWNAPEEQISQLADLYIKAVIEYGVVCCHHTCNNIRLNEWLASFSMLDQKTLEQFSNIYKAATYVDLNMPVREPNQPDPGGQIQWPSPQEEPEQELPEQDVQEQNVPKADAQPAVPQTPKTVVQTEPVIRISSPVTAGESQRPQNPEPANLENAAEEPEEQEEPDQAENTNADEGETKAYELNPVKADQSGQKPAAVALLSVVLGLVLVATGAFGYMKKKKSMDM